MPNDYVKDLLGTLTFDRQPDLWRFVSQDDPPDLREAIFALRESRGWTAIVPYRNLTEHVRVLVRFELRVETHLHPFGLGGAIDEILGEAEIFCFFVDGSWASSIFVDERDADSAAAILTGLKR